MAAGSDPPHIRHILEAVQPFACGLSLCGAGAGGFGAIILKKGVAEENLRQVIDRLNQEDIFKDSKAKLSLHTVQVDAQGLTASEHVCPDHNPLALKNFLL